MKATPKEYLSKVLLKATPSDTFRGNKSFQKFIDVNIPAFNKLKGLEQPKEYHSFDAYEHTLHTIDNAKADLILRLGAMFHDIGKINTQSIDANGRIRFIGHEKDSTNMAREILTRLEFEETIVNSVCTIILYHMRKLTFDDDGNFLGKNLTRSLNRFVAAFGSELERGLELINADNIAQKNDISAQRQVEGIIKLLVQLSTPPVSKSKTKSMKQ